MTTERRGTATPSDTPGRQLWITPFDEAARPGPPRGTDPMNYAKIIKTPQITGKISKK
jgi:hypothetical protein